MTRETASRQLWSSLSTWLRKPQMVVNGSNRRLGLDLVFVEDSQEAGLGQDLGEGSPWLRAKRARTASRFVMESLRLSGRDTGTEIGRARSAAASGHHSLFFAGQQLKETFKPVPFVPTTAA